MHVAKENETEVTIFLIEYSKFTNSLYKDVKKAGYCRNG
jgi:hypothetical protein